MSSKPEGISIGSELRAYGRPDCCRLASFILKLTEKPTLEPVEEMDVVSRDEVAELWRQKYPYHTNMSGARGVRGRITGTLVRLRSVEIARPMPDNTSIIQVIQPEYLAIVASNLTVVEDDKGFGVNPQLWSGHLRIPPHLQEAQKLLR